MQVQPSLFFDGRCEEAVEFYTKTLGAEVMTLTVPEAAAAEWLFAALADGGQVQMPLTTTFFAPRFGMVADRFGMSWRVTMAP